MLESWVDEVQVEAGEATQILECHLLQELHPPTLEFINETISKQESSKDPIDLRDVLENTRTILRRFTGLVLQDDMIPDDSEKPAEGETNKKTKIILDWVRKKIGEGYDREIDFTLATLDVLQAQKTALMGLVNKLGHGEVEDVLKGDVDRTLLSTIIWIADMISLLDKAGYEWDSNVRKESSQ